MWTQSVSHFVDIQTRKAQYINSNATVTLFGINPPSLWYHPVQLPCDQVPLPNVVVARTDCLVGAHTPNHLPACNPLHVTAIANVHTHHTQVTRSPVHARNTNHIHSVSEFQSYNTCWIFSSKKDKKIPKKYICVMDISKHSFDACLL